MRQYAPGTAIARRYQVRRLLGEGGMGVVYEVADVESGASRALKLLRTRARASAGARRALARFRREFAAVARLRHPACVRVYDFGEADGHPFYTMELASGVNFRGFHGAIWERIAALALDVLAALDHIHASGIVHRDVKPENILVTHAADRPSGERALVTDFGLARSEEEDLAFTTAGVAVGTLSYIAPEVLSGREADPRSDLFGLGVVLYEALTGELPFPTSPTGSLHEVRDALLRAPHPSFEACVGVPPELVRFVERLLARDPERRHATASHAYKALFDLVPPPIRGPAPRPESLSGGNYLVPPQFVGRSAEVERLREMMTVAWGGASGTSPGSSGTAVGTVVQRRACAVFVGGEAGVGKSRLIKEFGRRASGLGAAIFTGSCAGGRPTAPLDPWVSIVREAVASIGRVTGETTRDERTDVGGKPLPDPRAAHEWPGVDEPPSTLPSMRGGSDELRGDMFERHRDALAHLLPELRTSPAEGGLWEDRTLAGQAGTAVVGAEQRFKVLRGIAQFLLELTRQTPTCIVLEDVHWADEASLALLRLLARELSRQDPREGVISRVIVVATYRFDEVGPEHPLRRLVEAIVEDGSAALFPLKPLPKNRVIRMVASMLAAPEDAEVGRLTELLWKRTGGNPFWVQGVLRALIAEGRLRRDDTGRWQLDPVALGHLALPASLREMALRRVANLGTTYAEVIEAGAVAGGTFDPRLLAAASGLSENDVAEAVDRAVRGGLLLAPGAEGDDGASTRPAQPADLTLYRFVNDRLREALYESLPLDRRVFLHGRLASILAAGRGASAAELAHHASRAGPEWVDEAYRWRLRAGDQALDTASAAEALRHYELAEKLRADTVDPAERTRLQGRMADAYALLGRYSAAAEHYGHALEGQSLRPAARAELLRRRGEVRTRAGELTAAVTDFEEALALLGWSAPRSRVAVVVSLLWHFALTLPRAFSSRPPAAPPSDDTVRRLTTAARIYTRLSEALYFHDFVSALERHLRALRLAERIGRSSELAMACIHQGFALGMLPWRSLARRYISRGLTLAESLDDKATLARGLNMLGILHSCFGESRPQVEAHRRALGLLGRSGDPYEIDFAYVALIFASIQRGDRDGAWRAVKEHRRLVEGQAQPRSIGMSDTWRAELALLDGDAPAAIRRAQRAIELLSETADQVRIVRARCVLGRAQLVAGKLEAAIETLEAARAMREAAKIMDPADQVYAWLCEAWLVRAARSQPASAERREAVRKATEAWALARRMSRHFAYLRAPVARLAGGLAWMRGERATALRQWRSALKLAEASGLRWETARTRADVGRALVSAGEAHDGVVHLEAALYEFDGLGARGEVELLRELVTSVRARAEAAGTPMAVPAPVAGARAGADDGPPQEAGVSTVLAPLPGVPDELAGRYLVGRKTAGAVIASGAPAVPGTVKPVTVSAEGAEAAVAALAPTEAPVARGPLLTPPASTPDWMKALRPAPVVYTPPESGPTNPIAGHDSGQRGLRGPGEDDVASSPSPPISQDAMSGPFDRAPETGEAFVAPAPVGAGAAGGAGWAAAASPARAPESAPERAAARAPVEPEVTAPRPVPEAPPFADVASPTAAASAPPVDVAAVPVADPAPPPPAHVASPESAARGPLRVPAARPAGAPELDDDEDDGPVERTELLERPTTSPGPRA